MREPKCIVLTSPFSSALDIAREAYPWLPVALLMRHRFDSLALATRVRTPLLVLIGENDTLIAPAHSERLAKAWGGPVAVTRVRGGHDDLQADPRYLDALHAFLDARL
jgi:pimeloyl-ACP methyl ester carboxylesterase